MLTDNDLIYAREGMKKTLRALFVKTIYPDVPIYEYNEALRAHLHSKHITPRQKKLRSISLYVKTSVENAIELPEIQEMIKLKAAINSLKTRIIYYEARKHKINVRPFVRVHGEAGQK